MVLSSATAARGAWRARRPGCVSIGSAKDNTLMSLEGQDSERGYAMAALLVSLAVMSVLMSVALPAWRHEAQREKEAELVFRGEQYARAIALYRAKNANAFPPSVDVLVQGKFLRKKYLDPITNKDFDVIGVGAQAQVQGQGTGPTTGVGAGRGQSTQTSQTGRGTSSTSPAGSRGGTQSASGFTNLPGVSQNGFVNPTTGAVSGGIMGVHSKSQETSIRIYKGQTRYDQWNFVVTAVNRPGGRIGRDDARGAGRRAASGGPWRTGQHQPGPQRARRPWRSRHRTEFSAGPTAAPTPRSPAWAGRRRRRPEPLNGWPSLSIGRSVCPFGRSPRRCPHPLSKASVEGFDHRIVNLRPHASHRIVLARRVHAVGQQRRRRDRAPSRSRAMCR